MIWSDQLLQGIETDIESRLLCVVLQLLILTLLECPKQTTRDALDCRKFDISYRQSTVEIQTRSLSLQDLVPRKSETN